MPPRIYLDVCCLNRLTDDQSQPRVRREAYAVERIFEEIRRGRLIWVSSTIVEREVLRNRNAARRVYTLELLADASGVIAADNRDLDRAFALERFGFSQMDAQHVACAERAHADALLTTDDKFVRRAQRFAAEIHARVLNPIFWSEGRV
jgi:hypothetical protein